MHLNYAKIYILKIKGQVELRLKYKLKEKKKTGHLTYHGHSF